MYYFGSDVAFVQLVSQRQRRRKRGSERLGWLGPGWVPQWGQGGEEGAKEFQSEVSH